MGNPLRKLFLLIVAVSTLSGCSIYRINVSGISTTGYVRGQTFYLYPGNPAVRASDLQFQEFARYVAYEMQAQGYRHTSDPSKAALAIFLDYGIGNPKDSYHTQSITTNHPGQAWNMPEQSVTTTRTSYRRYVTLQAVDFAHYRREVSRGDPNPPSKQLWQLSITSRGSSGDLRKVFPIMVKAGRPYIGTNTGRVISLEIPNPEGW